MRSRCCSHRSHEGRCEVENQYSRVVREEGTRRRSPSSAMCSSCGRTSNGEASGSSLRALSSCTSEFAEFDAEVRYEIPGVRVADPKACQCGEVLKGVIKPWECKVFGTACTPETPIGTCMVSSEGACAAYYNFGRMHRELPLTHRPERSSLKDMSAVAARPRIGSATGSGSQVWCRAWVSGPSCYRLATELDLAGHVGNDSEGVFVEVEGRRSARGAVRDPAS